MGEGTGASPQRGQRDNTFAPTVYSEQRLKVLIDERRDERYRNLLRRCSSHQVGEDHARVPEAIAIRARTVFPGAAPEYRGKQRYRLRVAQLRPSRSAIRDERSPVANPKQAQLQIGGQEMIEGRFE